MCPGKLVLFCVMMVLVSSEKNGRDGRLFTFNTLDDNIRIDLEFSVPFISIPVKRVLTSASDIWSQGIPAVNVNPISLVVAGTVLIGTTVLLPLLTQNYGLKHPQHRFSRLLESAEFSTAGMLDYINQVLKDTQSIPGCAQRIACWSAQRTTDTVVMKTWMQIMSNDLLSSMINTTAIEDAMLSGRNGRDCMKYTPCPLQESHVSALLNNLPLSNSLG